MSNTERPADRKISSSASLFKKVLQAFANGDLPYSDVESHLQRLLNSGASPEELREVLQRYESIEPLPAYARVEILRTLNEAIARTAWRTWRMVSPQLRRFLKDQPSRLPWRWRLECCRRP